MNRFENLTPQKIAAIINGKINSTLLISQKIAQTSNFPENEILSIGMPSLSEEIMKKILAHSVIAGNDVKTNWMTFILFVTYVDGNISYININQTDCQIEVTF